MIPARVPVPPPALARELTAFHEAGHFLAALDRGAQVREVTIRPKGNLLGWASSEEGLGVGEVADARLRALVVEYYAGHAAQCGRDRRFVGYSRAGAASDDASAERYLRLLPTGAARSCRVEAARLVKRRWREVEAVARALLDREELSGEEAEVIADVAAGRSTAADMAAWRAARG